MRKLISLLIISTLLFSVAGCRKTVTLTVLHTNDTHSQVEPNSKDLGGYTRRMGLIEQERAIDPELLLVDAGDFCQGTPYFNYYRGRVEIDAMNRMGYDAATLGNHEFDNGLDTLAVILKMAHFPVVCANYDFTGTALEDIIKPWCIVEKKGLKIGIFGLGVSPYGLIAEKNFAPAKYLPPYEAAEKCVRELKEQGCDLILCLSHIGTYRLDDETAPYDVEMAQKVAGIDGIIGGHTHQVYDLTIPNPEGRPIPVRQTGKSGPYLGKIMFNLK